MQFQSLNSPPHDARSIPWDSVVLPLGTPGGAYTRGSQRVPVSWFGLCGHSLGAVPQPRLHPRQVFIAEVQPTMVHTLVCTMVDQRVYPPTFAFILATSCHTRVPSNVNPREILNRVLSPPTAACISQATCRLCLHAPWHRLCQPYL